MRYVCFFNAAMEFVYAQSPESIYERDADWIILFHLQHIQYCPISASSWPRVDFSLQSSHSVQISWRLQVLVNSALTFTGTTLQ